MAEPKTNAKLANRAVKKGEVSVRVVKQPIGEDGETYNKGQTFTCSEKRAQALGPLVEPVTEKEEVK